MSQSEQSVVATVAATTAATVAETTAAAREDSRVEMQSTVAVGHSGVEYDARTHNAESVVDGWARRMSEIQPSAVRSPLDAELRDVAGLSQVRAVAMHIYVYTYLCVCMCVCVCVYIHIYIHIYTYIHIYKCLYMCTYKYTSV